MQLNPEKIEEVFYEWSSTVLSKALVLSKTYSRHVIKLNPEKIKENFYEWSSSSK